MVKNLFVMLALAVGLFFLTQTGDADARWRCGPGACWWTPGYTGYVPPTPSAGVHPIVRTVIGGSAAVAHGGTTASKNEI